MLVLPSENTFLCLLSLALVPVMLLMTIQTEVVSQD